VGKSPLAKALARFHPDLSANLQPIVLFNSRSPRPGERDGEDYHFRAGDQIERLRDQDRYVVMDVRGDLQALDLEDLAALLQKGDAFFEGNPFIGRTLQTHPKLHDVNRLSVFLSPVSRAELLFLRDQASVCLPDLVGDVMRRKLLRRAERQKTHLSLKDLEEIERRAGSTYRELQEAHHFEYVIPNHEGEDSDNWEAFYFPLGDARRALLAVVALLRGEEPKKVERWEKDWLP
jgi:guanylate kinase